MRWALAVGLLLTATACGSSRHVVISQDGRIGPLRMDRSTRADVISFAGKPDAERKGVEFDSTPYAAVGYGCSARSRDDSFPLLEVPGKGRAGPNCRTIFWINRRTARLGDFYTSSSRYEEGHGVRVGMRSAVVEQLLHKRLVAGCSENIYLPSAGEPALTVAFDGGVTHIKAGAAGRVTGARVFALTLHGRRSDIGIFDCL